MAREYGLVDPFITIPAAGGGARTLDPSLSRIFARSTTYFAETVTVENMIEDMDEAGIEKAVVHTRTAGTQIPPNPFNVGQNPDDETFDANCAQVAEAVKRWPDRLQGCVPI